MPGYANPPGPYILYEPDADDAQDNDYRGPKRVFEPLVNVDSVGGVLSLALLLSGAVPPSLAFNDSRHFAWPPDRVSGKI